MLKLVRSCELEHELGCTRVETEIGADYRQEAEKNLIVKEVRNKSKNPFERCDFIWTSQSVDLAP